MYKEITNNTSGNVIIKSYGRMIFNSFIKILFFILIFSLYIIYIPSSYAQNKHSKVHNLTNKINDIPESYDWLQFDFNPQHNGNDTKEKIISLQNVNMLHTLFKISLPSIADGAPAYLSNVKTSQGNMNMLFVTTKDGHIIGINAANGKTVWSHQYGTGSYRINNGFSNTYTTSSPAIDPDKKYVYSYGLDGYVHKYQVDNGNEIKGGRWPELCTLKPFNEKGSSALAIAAAKNGISYLYVANGGYLGDRGDYQGHVTTINLSNGTQTVFNANGSSQTVHFVEQPGKPDWHSVQSAVWARPGVIYDENTDKIYFATGNGPFDPSGHNWGDAVLAIKPDGTGMNGFPVDSYSPANFADLDNRDLDLGSTAPAIIPTPHNCKIKELAVQSGKDRKLRLINLSNLSGKGGPGNVGGEIGNVIDLPSNAMVFSQPAVWINPKDKSSWIYIGVRNLLAAYILEVNSTGYPYLELKWKQSKGSTSPIIANNILFCAESGNVRALDPVTGKLLWQSDDIGNIHWESPIVDNGILFLTDQSGNLTAFGL